MAMATPEFCEKVIRQMLRSYPPRMSETTTEYIASLMTVLVGKPENIVGELPHPELGVLARCKFLPTVADVHEWMKPKLIFEYSQLESERREEQQLLERQRDEPTEEDKERVLRVWNKARNALLAKATPQTTIDWGKTQAKDHSALLKTEIVQRE